MTEKQAATSSDLREAAKWILEPVVRLGVEETATPYAIEVSERLEALAVQLDSPSEELERLLHDLSHELKQSAWCEPRESATWEAAIKETRSEIIRLFAARSPRKGTDAKCAYCEANLPSIRGYHHHDNDDGLPYATRCPIYFRAASFPAPTMPYTAEEVRMLRYVADRGTHRMLVGDYSKPLRDLADRLAASLNSQEN